MRIDRFARPARTFAATMPMLACSGCAMLGELFYTPGLRLVVLVVVALALLGFVVSRTDRR